jgi:hypothetical protein
VQRKLNVPLRYPEQGIITLGNATSGHVQGTAFIDTVIILHSATAGDGLQHNSRRQRRVFATVIADEPVTFFGGQITVRARASFFANILSRRAERQHICRVRWRPEPTCLGKGDCIRGSCSNTARTALRRGAGTDTLRDAAAAAAAALRHDVL